MFSGAVLAGGRSSRFGTDKAHYVYRGKPLLEWVLESMGTADERFIVSSRPYDLGVPVYPDVIEGGSSLSGLHAALSYAAYDWVALAACDMPFLTPSYWELLLDETRDGVQVVIVRSETGRLESLAALYHRSLLPTVSAQLAAGNLKMRAVAEEAAERAAVRVLPWSEVKPIAGPEALLNANRLGDLP